MTDRPTPLLEAPAPRRRTFIPFGSITMMLVLGLMAAGCSKQQQESAVAGGDRGYAQDIEDTQPIAEESAGAAAYEAHPALEAFHGSWALDIDATVAHMPEAEQELARGFFQRLEIGMRFEDNGRAKMSFASQGELVEQTGDYRFEAQQEDATIVELVSDNPAFGADEGQMFIRAVFLDADTMRYDSLVKVDGVFAEETQPVVLNRISDEDYDQRFKASSASPAAPEGDAESAPDAPIQAP